MIFLFLETISGGVIYEIMSHYMLQVSTFKRL